MRNITSIQTKVKTYSIDRPAEMVVVAKVIKEYIIKNNLSVQITGKDYVMVEGWQFAGSLMSLFPRIVKVEQIKPNEWLAQAEIINRKTKEVVGTGFALCSKAEAKKATFDEYAILSMAQTRAIGKAFRNVIGWIIKLAGYEPTPAEEMKKVEVKKPSEPETGTDHISKLKKELYKMGVKDEKGALKMVKDKTGLVWKDFKITQKQAQIALFMLLNVTKE